MLLQVAFADANCRGGDLYQLIIFDKLQRLLQGEFYRWGKQDILIGSCGTDIGQLLALQCINHQVIRARVDANHLPLVDLLSMAQKELATLLQVKQ